MLYKRTDRVIFKIKQYRRVATRHDKLAANYRAFIQLASISPWLRCNEAAPLLLLGHVDAGPRQRGLRGG
jgi:hypothetical protein